MLSALPTQLRPWAELLSLFPAELALQLGAWLPRLASAVGPLRTRQHLRSGEPNGFDGVDRRGTYERLLATEWLLADEHPDEFHRRAVMREHSFLQLALRTPATAPSCFVLFDAGPSQLGAPRLAHLALLLLFARRAREARAEFRWGVLQSPPFDSTPELSRAGVQSLLDARSAREPTQAALQAWEEKTPQGERWLVGGERLQPLARDGTHGLVLVNDPLRIEDSTLAVQVKPPSKPVRRLVLELPSPPDRVRLLRQPFEATTALVRTTAAVPPPVQFLVTQGAHPRLCVLDEKGQVRFQMMPVTARQPLGFGTLFRPNDGETVLGLGVFARNMQVLTQDSTRLRMYRVGKRGGATLLSERPRPLGLPDDGVLRPLLFGSSAEQFVPLAADTLRFHAFEPCELRGARALAAIDEGGNQLSWLWDENERTGRKALLVVAGQERMLPSPLRPGGAHFGRAHSSEDGGFLLAVEFAPQLWTLMNAHSLARVLRAPSDTTVVGVGRRGASAPGLVLLNEDRRTFVFLDPSGFRELFKAPLPVVQAQTSPYCNQFIYLCRDGQLGVYSLARGELIAQQAPAGRERSP